MRPSKTISKTKLRIRDAMFAGRRAVTRASTESPSDNVFHCCVHKSGSQWIRRILKDARVYKYSGLQAHHYQSAMPGGHDPRPLTARTFSSPFPLRTIVTPIYIDYPGYRDIPKPESSRSFFVTRDPRDVVVSWYFSSKLSHRLMGDLHEVRGSLADLDQVQGLIYSIEHLNDFGLFAAQRSWLQAADDPTSLVVRFEDLTGPDALQHFVGLFAHCRMKLPERTLEEVLETYSFERLSGRARGDEDEHTHFRKGVSGDWRNHFVPEVREAFDRVTSDLVQLLGYPQS